MRTPVETYLSQIYRNNTVRSIFRKTRQALSLLVVFAVFWCLKLTGITMAGEAFCGIPEHTHGENCMLQELICTLDEAPAHTHTEECMHCPLPEQEGHTHGEACISRTLTCTLDETDGHIHSTDCHIRTLECSLPEESAHAHSDACYIQETGCGMEESDDHNHDETCLVSVLICEIPETPGHIHTEECYSIVQLCALEESEGHVHGDSCYTIEPGYICGKEEAPEHFHTEECLNPEEGHYFCGLEESEGHAHADACYRILESCPIAEHTHTPDCYSDISADVETSDDWEDSLSGLTRSPTTAENLLMIARSQLGMAESTRNFQVGEDGIRRGITRYGQWYGNPYGDWSAMFVSFCLEYAGVFDVPMNAGPESMRLGWEIEELYVPKTDLIPYPGLLLFLDKDENGTSDAMAVITGLVDDILFVIEGDLDEPVIEIGDIQLYPDPETIPTFEEDAPHSVMETLYDIADPIVMGYGLVPDSSGLMLLPEGGTYAARHTVWLDGTNGGLMSLGGSPNTAYTVNDYTYFTLPTEWRSPDKYSYTLRGWYDVVNNKYYAPGDQVYINNQNLVFYADWAAATYDVGQYNSFVDTETISTNDFVTVRMFDYSMLFNVLSERANVSINGSSSHTETWNLITNGNNPYNGQPTLNYIFRDWDRGSEDISYPNGTNDRNNPTDAGTVYPGLYTNTIRDLLFNPNTQAIGKQYLGTGDYLFQLCLDPSHNHYGYYYYNSERNAASYNQSEQRFYVYNYLECTRTSSTAADESKYSDFLPLNSPYANTNGKQVITYNYAGTQNEYNGTTHYLYDCRYNDNDNSPNNVGTNFNFGMSVEIDFYLPNDTGAVLADGYGNQDLYGNDMHFRFTGDDDVWVFVDGVMVMDLGGLHGSETGDINFSSGQVTINGVVNTQLTNSLKQIKAGEHTLTLYYLERGSSMSNCAIYFNLAPRFSFSIQKEDTLTRDVLNGAQFSVYTDEACTVPAQLWTSKAAHDRGEASTNTFTVVNGSADMWGMGAGNTYYIKETKPPDNEDYAGLSNGVIRLVFNKSGSASYNVEIQDTGGGVTPGFTVHGFRIDAQTQRAYIVATNSPVWVQDATSVQAMKRWNDGQSHSGQSITVYLTVTDQDGTVRRLREATLSDDNNWHVKWENLPKYWKDGTPVRYGVEEAYIPGYQSTVTSQTGQFDTTQTSWVEWIWFEDGDVFILKNAAGQALSTLNDSADTGFQWISVDAARSSPLARWTADVRQVNGAYQVRLTNDAGQTISFYHGGGNYYTDFFALKEQLNNDPNRTQNFTLHYNDSTGRPYLMLSYNNYYISNTLDGSNKFPYTQNTYNALQIYPEREMTTGGSVPITGQGYLITNTPLDRETSLTVYKNWDYVNLPYGTAHEKAQVTIRLLANGVDTGRTVTLNLQNGWQGAFRGLPYTDEHGNVISYTVEESWNTPDWIPAYGEIVVNGGSTPTYSTTVTNQYRLGFGGPELPSTGSAARLMFILCGFGIMLGSLVYGFGTRRKRERRMK